MCSMCRYQFVVPTKREYWVHWEVLSSLTEGRVRIDPDRIRCAKKAKELQQISKLTVILKLSLCQLEGH